MAGRTTSFILVGEFGAGPFQTREWKARHGVALIEKHRRVWMPTPVAHSAGERTPQTAIYLPSGLSAAEELVVVVAAACIQDSRVTDSLEVQGLTIALDLNEWAAARWINVTDDRLENGPPVLGETVDLSVDAISDFARLGVVRLETWSEINDDAILWLRSRGLDVEVFASEPVGHPTSNLES